MQNITFQSLFSTPTVKESRLNSQGMDPYGRIFEYLKATEAISQYMIVSNPANTDVDTVSSSADGDSDKVYITEGSAGWTVGDYQDHWGIVDSGTGVGQIFKIKDNTADTLELYKDYKLTTALAVADSDIVIRHEPDAEKVAVTVEKTPLKGVAQVAFASADYGWFLKRGIGGVLLGGAGTINVTIKPGDDTEGTGAIVADGNDLFDISVIGRILVASDTADKANLVDVNII